MRVTVNSAYGYIKIFVRIDAKTLFTFVRYEDDTDYYYNSCRSGVKCTDKEVIDMLNAALEDKRNEIAMGP